MPEPDLASFDPYEQWLGIPPSEQPPDHYRLLGLARFEIDPTRIAAAADARMALLRSVQTGPRGLIAQKIMNEVAAARVCLLSPERKSLYDEELWQCLAAQTHSTPTADTMRPAVPAFTASLHSTTEMSTPAVISGARFRRRRHSGVWIWVIATGLAVAGLAMLAYVLSKNIP